jgi:transposase
MENIIPKSIDPISYFTCLSPVQRQYLALRRFFVDKAGAQAVANEFGYTLSTVYTLARDFRRKLDMGQDPFFITNKPGRPRIDPDSDMSAMIVECRKKSLSVPQIKTALDAAGLKVSERTITHILDEEGFARLPRRDAIEIAETVAQLQTLTAPKSATLTRRDVLDFSSQAAGLLCFLPIIKAMGLDEAILQSDYPQTNQISRLQAILSFLAIKLSNFERYSADDIWCMDRGLGLFAGLNVLPKTAWFSSYSSAVTREMNASFMKSLQRIWGELGLLGDTVSLDFTAIPYWGSDTGLENNWSGKHSRALTSLMAVLAQNPENGILCYGDTTIRHANQNAVVFEFLDFYTADKSADVKYLIFDSRFTTYENLAKLNSRGIKFITIQRRSAGLEAKIANIPESRWKAIRVPKAKKGTRSILVAEDEMVLEKQNVNVRQIFLKNAGREKPAIIITNDFALKTEAIVRKYALRWLVEKEIAEQIGFFHLNRNSSGIVVKVDFDLTMTMLAHNLYRIMAMELEGYGACEAKSIFNKFILNGGHIKSSNDEIVVSGIIK